MSLTRKKFLSDEELKDLMRLLDKFGTEGLNKRDALLIKLMLFTGARPCETLKIRLEDLHDNAVTVYGAKGSNDRTVPLPAAFVKALREYAEGKDVSEPLFPISTRHFRRIWDKWRASRKPKLHGLRHTFGVKFYNNSNNVHALKTCLGHRNIQNTMVYLDFVEGTSKLRDEAEGMWSKPLAG